MALPMDDERVVPGHRDQQRQEQFHAFTPCRDAQPASSSRIQPFCATSESLRLLGLLGLPLRRARHRIVAARRPRMAAQQPAAGQPAALDRAVHLHRPQRVRRTAGVVAAHVAVERADHQPLGLQQADQDVLHGAAAGLGVVRRVSRARACDQAVAKSTGTSSGAVAARGRARTTTLTGSVVRGSSAAARWRSRRRTRLRVTAFPTFLPTTKPTWAGRAPDARSRVSSCARRGPRGRPPARYAAWSTRVGRPTRTPPRTVRRKSSERRILCSRGSTEMG